MRKYKTKLDFTLKEILRDMIRRCYDERRWNYQYYGAKGIEVCDKWKHDFFAFKQWALESGYKTGLSIDRINLKGNYTPENCRWVDRHIQCSNRSKRSDNSSGYTGVTFDKSRNKWVAYICIHRKNKYLGSFSTPEEARDKRNQYILENNLTEYNLQ